MRKDLLRFAIVVLLGLGLGCSQAATGGGDGGHADGTVTDGGGSDAGPDGGGDAGTPDAGLPWDGHLRIVTGNLTSGNYQAYEDYGIRIFQGLHPDVALVQEFNYGDDSDTAIRTFIDTAFGPGFSYYRETDNEQIPNGVVSRFPIIASGEWTDTNVANRDFAWAQIDLPGPVDLWAVSVHLLTKSSASRDAEAVELVQFIEANVPAGAYLVVGGDLNTGSRTEACVSTLAAVVTTTDAQPVDQSGNGDTNASRAKPYDWVLPDADLDAYHVPTVIGQASFADGLVFDSRVYTPLTDVAPIQAGDSGAPSMQHMAVVKDFLLP